MRGDLNLGRTIRLPRHSIMVFTYQLQRRYNSDDLLRSLRMHHADCVTNCTTRAVPASTTRHVTVDTYIHTYVAALLKLALVAADSRLRQGVVALQKCEWQ
jgi:hypothetical protein